MDVLAASAERQKEIARAIAGELKEQDDVEPLPTSIPRFCFE
jgi:hypothetical protein